MEKQSAQAGGRSCTPQAGRFHQHPHLGRSTGEGASARLIHRCVITLGHRQRDDTSFQQGRLHLNLTSTTVMSSMTWSESSFHLLTDSATS